MTNIPIDEVFGVQVIFIYLNTVLIDTPISNDSIYGYIKRRIDCTAVHDRLDITQKFVDYLVQSEEEEFMHHPEYVTNEFTRVRFSRHIQDHFKIEKALIIQELKEKLIQSE